MWTHRPVVSVDARGLILNGLENSRGYPPEPGPSFRLPIQLALGLATPERASLSRQRAKRSTSDQRRHPVLDRGSARLAAGKTISTTDVPSVCRASPICTKTRWHAPTPMAHRLFVQRLRRQRYDASCIPLRRKQTTLVGRGPVTTDLRTTVHGGNTVGNTSWSFLPTVPPIRPCLRPATNYGRSFEACGQSPLYPARCRCGLASPTLRPDARVSLADQAHGANAEKPPGPLGKWPRPGPP